MQLFLTAGATGWKGQKGSRDPSPTAGTPRNQARKGETHLWPLLLSVADSVAEESHSCSCPMPARSYKGQLHEVLGLAENSSDRGQSGLSVPVPCLAPVNVTCQSRGSNCRKRAARGAWFSWTWLWHWQQQLDSSFLHLSFACPFLLVLPPSPGLSSHAQPPAYVFLSPFLKSWICPGLFLDQLEDFCVPICIEVMYAFLNMNVEFSQDLFENLT